MVRSGIPGPWGGTRETEQIVIPSEVRLGAILTFISLVALLARPAYGQADAFHILLTNDEGVESPGIQALAEAIGEVGLVHLVAP